MLIDGWDDDDKLAQLAKLITDHLQKKKAAAAAKQGRQLVTPLLIPHCKASGLRVGWRGKALRWGQAQRLGFAPSASPFYLA